MTITKYTLAWGGVYNRADTIARAIEERRLQSVGPIRIYGVPRGGIYAAQAVVARFAGTAVMVDDPLQCDVIIDDIIDSGKTREAYAKYDKPFYALVDKLGMGDATLGWVQFPWEIAADEDGIEDNVRRILQFIGEDPDREGLKETPKRVAKSYGELFRGYKQDPKDIITMFEDDLGSLDEMIILKDIEFVSYCEHHMLPFRGKAHIAYIPNKKVIGISKLARILDIYAARLQIQERISSQVTTALMANLQPQGAACILEAHHQCMSCRGVMKQNSVMITSSLEGVFRDAAVRSELLALIRK